MRHFPNWLQAYLEYTAQSEAPQHFHYWTGVSTIAGALQRHVWVAPSHMYEYPINFYTVLVAPAGVATKSTSISAGMKLLGKVKGVHFGPESFTWQALSKALEEAATGFRVNPEDEPYPIACLTIAASELGTLLNLEDPKLSSVLIRMWDGQRDPQPFQHKTATTGTTQIYNPWLNIIGATTPAWLRQHFPEHMIGEGLTSRIIFVYGDRKRHLRAYPRLYVDLPRMKEMEEKLIDDLVLIADMKGEFGLTPDAYEYGQRLYEDIITKRPAALASARYDSYISRKFAHLHKIAVVWNVARDGHMELTADDLKVAQQLLESIEPQMLKVFESIGSSHESSRVSELAYFVERHGPITPKDLYPHVFNIMTLDDFKAAIQSGVEAGVFLKMRIRVSWSDEMVMAIRMNEPGASQSPGLLDTDAEPPDQSED